MTKDDSGRLLNADNTMTSMSLLGGMADTYSNESDEDDDDDTDEDDNDSDDDAEDSGDELANYFLNDNNNAAVDGIVNENATLIDRSG